MLKGCWRNIKGQMIGTGELLFGVKIGWRELRLPEQIENRAVGGDEVGDLALVNERS